jgi:hypothetical protein
VNKPTEDIGADVVGAKPVLQVRRLLTNLQIGPAIAIRNGGEYGIGRFAGGDHRLVIGCVESVRYEDIQKYNATEDNKNAYENLPP